MDESSIEAGLQGVAITLFGLLLVVADIALFQDGGTLLVIGGAIVGLVGVVHSFRPLL